MSVGDFPTRSPRVYVITSSSVHIIRECLQIILDFAEQSSSEVVIRQVHRIEQEISCPM